MDRYILDDEDNAVPCYDDEKFNAWYNNADRKVAQEHVGGWFVSTVFLALDHRYGDGPPMLFETMVFPTGSFMEDYCERCTTMEQAIEQHKVAVAKYKDKPCPEPEEVE